MNKKGIELQKEIIELLLAIVVIFVLGTLFVRLLFPFDKDSESAKGYLDNLKKAIADADAGKVGEFAILPRTEDATMFYLVYFPKYERISMSLDNEQTYQFLPSNSIGKRGACICYIKDDKPVCNQCMPLGQIYVGNLSTKLDKRVLELSGINTLNFENKKINEESVYLITLKSK